MLGKKKALSISSYQQNPNLIRCSGGRIHQTITFNNSKICFCGVFLRQNITSSKSRTPKLSKFSLLFIVFPVFFYRGFSGSRGNTPTPIAPKKNTTNIGLQQLQDWLLSLVRTWVWPTSKKMPFKRVGLCKSGDSKISRPEKQLKFIVKPSIQSTNPFEKI